METLKANPEYRTLQDISDLETKVDRGDLVGVIINSLEENKPNQMVFYGSENGDYIFLIRWDDSEIIQAVRDRKGKFDVKNGVITADKPSFKYLFSELGIDERVARAMLILAGQ